MATYLEMVQPREWTSANGSGTEWVKLGKAWPAKNGNGFSLDFSALPIPTLKDGKLETRVLLREPLPPRDGYAASPARAAPTSRATAFDDDLNDDIRF